MTATEPCVTTSPEPLIVSVKEARRMLGGMCAAVFWQKAKTGVFGPIIGPSNKKYVLVENLKRYVASMPRERHVDNLSLANSRNLKGRTA